MGIIITCTIIIIIITLLISISNVRYNKRIGLSSFSFVNIIAVIVLIARLSLSVYTLRLHHDFKKIDRFFEQTIKRLLVIIWS